MENQIPLPFGSLRVTRVVAGNMWVLVLLVFEAKGRNLMSSEAYDLELSGGGCIWVPGSAESGT